MYVEPQPDHLIRLSAADAKLLNAVSQFLKSTPGDVLHDAIQALSENVLENLGWGEWPATPPEETPDAR